jgi:hypothetical protein
LLPLFDPAGAHLALLAQWGNDMELPKIDLSALPDLETLTGVFGSLSNPVRAMEFDDSVVVIMVYVYDVLIP